MPLLWELDFASPPIGNVAFADQATFANQAFDALGNQFKIILVFREVIYSYD